jgi:hypothetical protein
MGGMDMLIKIVAVQVLVVVAEHHKLEVMEIHIMEVMVVTEKTYLIYLERILVIMDTLLVVAVEVEIHPEMVDWVVVRMVVQVVVLQAEKIIPAVGVEVQDKEVLEVLGVLE